MMTEHHDDWSTRFDATGRELTPAMPSPQEVTDLAVAGKPPTAEMQRAFGVEPTTPATAAPVPAKSKGFSGQPDWGDKPRDEGGKFVTKSEGEFRQMWEREGGLAQVAQIVTAKEQAMYSVAPSLRAKIATLDKGFLMKAADHLRLGIGYGPDGFWRSVAQFEDSLTPSEKQTWANLLRGLDDDEKCALIYGMTK